MKNNVRGSIIILEALAIIITATLILRIKANKDIVPPVITFPEGTVSYTQGDDPQVLLSGVTALDERDGDVTDSIIISSISVADGEEAIAVYHAKDTGNNVAMAVRSVRFTPNDAAGISGIPVNTEPADIEVMPDADVPDQSLPETPGDENDDVSQVSAADVSNENTVDGENTDGSTNSVDSAPDMTDSSEDGADTGAAATQETQPESADSVLASYESMDPDSYTSEDMERI
ncbi:MAG: hypothetical protein IKD59_06535, partial [Lachnospiraceae bacterium]|nr:hypothetical protein [Lachnospiraceae bacterium]